MVPTEVLRKVRRIQIITSAVVNDVFAGQYHSAFKGRGMEFEEVREYQPGDDVRTIDWNVTARAGRPFIKSYREERELTVMLVVDVSASQDFGTHDQLKSELVAEIGATLALSAIQNNDKVGLMLFTDRIERFVPARKGARHVLRVVRELLYRDPTETPAYVPRPHERPGGREPTGRGTDVALALRYLDRVLTRRSVVFLVSDFQTAEFAGPLRIVRHRHDLIPIVISDPRELELPAVRFIELLDPETGEQVVVNASSREFQRRFAARTRDRQARLMSEFRKLGIDTINVRTGEPFVMPLTRFFRRRESRR